MASAFALSYRQLAALEQHVFRLLGVPSWERFRAATVAALAGLSLKEAQQVLDGLVDVHLVEEPEPERYRMHDLVRQYASNLADVLPSSERDAALDGLVDLHLQVGVRHAINRESGLGHEDFPVDPPLRPDLVEHGAADPQWQEEHRRDLVTLIRTAAMIGQPDRAWRLARVNWRFLFHHAYLADVLAACEQGLAAAEDSNDRYGIAVMNNYLASGYFRLGRADEALDRVNVMLEQMVRDGNRPGERRARINRCAVLGELGRVPEALADIKRAYGLTVGTAMIVPGALCVNMANTQLLAGRYVEALWHGRIALQRIAETKTASSLSGALLAVGQSRLHLGHLEPAERLLYAALWAARRHRVYTDESESLDLLGVLALAQGLPAIAVERHLAALELGRKHGRLPRIARYSNDLARALRALDDVPGAVEVYRKALEAARRSKFLIEEGRALSGLAACTAADDGATARRYWTEALEIFTRMGVPERDEVERRLAELDR